MEELNGEVVKNYTVKIKCALHAENVPRDTKYCAIFVSQGTLLCVKYTHFIHVYKLSPNFSTL